MKIHQVLLSVISNIDKIKKIKVSIMLKQDISFVELIVKQLVKWLN